MKVLVIGGGGREHALAWKLAQSPRVSEVLVAPGNAGTALEPRCRNVAVPVEEIAALLQLARDEKVGLTVVGPEGPLAAGIVDTFEAAGLRCFGPRREAAQLESSKAFAKDFLARHRIPTATYRVHTDLATALADIEARGAPIVIKADGLAAGKGVVVAMTVDDATAAARDMLGGNSLGTAGSRVVVEDFLDGEEASFIVMAAGGHALELATSQDHKRVGDGDTGPNTGGMGAYSPAPVVTDAVRDRVRHEVIEPTLAGLRKDGIDFTGFLYAGLMIDQNGAPRVLEFNCRLGDPETQPLMMRLKSDLVDLVEAALDKRLDATKADWDPRPALGVVMAAQGYPGNYRKKDAIAGFEGTEAADLKVFHAGTAVDPPTKKVITTGGRVLCVCALGKDVAGAQKRAYEGVKKISWEGVQYRSDIGFRAINRDPSLRSG
ncbi:MAG TPA: phosphoribosylamine--glycine ligase [Verrucomicrobiae bacterium]|nr:phosphoribosylamine--glycine ligase [Verrucomicrobiae bacterium]